MSLIGPQAQTQYGHTDVGCYVDGIWGVYAGQNVQEIARVHNWPGYPKDYTPSDHDDCVADWKEKPELPRHDEIDHGIHYDESTDDATEFMNTLTDDDVTFAWIDGDFLLVEFDETEA